MARRARILRGETLDLYAEQESTPDRLGALESLFETFSVAELQSVRVLAAKIRRAKLEEAKALVIAETEGRVKALGLTMREVFPSHKPGTKRGAPVKYRSSSGQTWSGRGHTPTWLRLLEEQGHTREEFRVTEG